MAVGRVVAAFGAPGVSAGDVVAHAWSLRRGCEFVGCYDDLTDLTFSEPDVTTQLFTGNDAALVGTGQTSVKACPGTASADYVSDDWDVRWASHDELSAQEDVSDLCRASLLDVEIKWTATRVPQTTIPALPISNQHVGSHDAFIAAATSVCTRVNAQLAPLARTIEQAERAIPNQGAVSDAESAVRLAAALPKIVPLAARIFSDIPQPPQPLGALWVRAVQIERNALVPSIDYTAAVSLAMTALSQYDLTENSLYSQEAKAYLALAKADYNGIPSPDSLINPIEQTLRLPTICTNLPAYRAAITSSED
jgi:hypothetical protein